MRKIILYLAVLCIFFAPVQSFAADLPENQDTVIQVKNPNFENAKMQIIEELNLSKGSKKKLKRFMQKQKKNCCFE